MSAPKHAPEPSTPGLPGVPLEPYRSAEFFALERDRIFRRAWLLMGREEELGEPGAFLVKEIEIVGASILLVRGKDCRIRAFHNVCPHRGNQVVWEEHGRAPVLMCRYHNWTFSTDGRLSAIPDPAMFGGLDKQKCGLAPVSLAIWDGWVFVHLAPEPEISLETFLGGMGDYLTGIRYFNADTPVVIRSYLKSNWKIVADAFAEAYHIPAIHSVSLKPRFASDDNPFGRPLDVRFHGPHGVNSMFGRSDYAPRPDQHIERLAFDPRHRGGAATAAAAQFAGHPAINPTKTGNWSMDVNYIFPNTHIDTNPLGFFTHQFWPISERETRHEARFYVGKPNTIRERFAIEHRMAQAVDVVLEDLSNVERTQRGVDSRGTDMMQLSESEALLRHAAHHIRKWAAAPTATAALATGSNDE